MKKTIISMVLAAMLIAGCATQQQKEQRKEQREMMRKAVAEAVATRRVHIGVTTMNTMRYGSRTVTPDFFLELRGDTMQSYLPYLGQAYQAPMVTPSQGLNFEAPVVNYRLSTKGNASQLEMDVKTKEDSYHYRIEIHDTGQAYIHVRPLQRDPVSFNGYLEKE